MVAGIGKMGVAVGEGAAEGLALEVGIGAGVGDGFAGGADVGDGLDEGAGRVEPPSSVCMVVKLGFSV